MKKTNGSFTLEAVIVMTTIIFILFAVLYAFMLMYQNVIVTYAASYAAQQGAVTWVNSGLDINTGEGNYNSEPYYRIAELAGGGSSGAKKTKIKSCAENKLKMGILPVKDNTVNVEFKNYLIQRQVQVEIKQTVPIPFGGIAKFFNGGNDFTIKTKSVAIVPEPAEYIRNVDYAIETATSLTKWINEKLHISDAFSKITSKIGSSTR